MPSTSPPNQCYPDQQTDFHISLSFLAASSFSDLLLLPHPLPPSLSRSPVFFRALSLAQCKLLVIPFPLFFLFFFIIGLSYADVCALTSHLDQIAGSNRCLFVLSCIMICFHHILFFLFFVFLLAFPRFFAVGLSYADVCALASHLHQFPAEARAELMLVCTRYDQAEKANNNNNEQE